MFFLPVLRGEFLISDDLIEVVDDGICANDIAHSFQQRHIRLYLRQRGKDAEVGALAVAEGAVVYANDALFGGDLSRDFNFRMVS